MSDAKNPSLRELLAQPVDLPVGDITVPVRPMGWYQAAGAIDKLMPVLQAQAAGGADTAEAVLGAVIAWRDEISAFCAEASGLPEQDLRELAPTLIVDLLLGLLELNADFFVQSLPAVVARAGERMARLKPKLVAVLDEAKGFSTPSSA